MSKNEVPAAETAEVSVLAAAKKQKAEKPVKKQDGGVATSDGGAAPQKKSHVGVIIAIIVGVLIIAGAIVATLLIINLNNGSKKEDDKSQTAKDDDKKDDAKNDGKDDDGKDDDDSKKNSDILSSDHYRGKADSSVLVIEYADPQCPGCAQMMRIMDSIYKKYGDKVAFVYRHYPLSYHKNGRSAAIATEAAAKQGFFWEMLSKLFSTQSDWETLSGDSVTNKFAELFKSVAGSKADVDQFKKDLESEKLAAKVDADQQLGKKASISATPTIIVNGEEVDFFNSTKGTESVISEAIETALNGKKDTPKDDDDDDDDDDDWGDSDDDDDDDDDDWNDSDDDDDDDDWGDSDDDDDDDDDDDWWD